MEAPITASTASARPGAGAGGMEASSPPGGSPMTPSGSPPGEGGSSMMLSCDLTY